MNKKVFFVIVSLMSIALIGIISVQWFWIQTAIDNKERQFSLNVNAALQSVSEQVSERELREYLAVYQKLLDSVATPKESEITAVFQYVDRNVNTNKTYVYNHGILEEDYNITPSLIDDSFQDTFSIKEYKSIQLTTIIDESFENEMRSMSSIERLQRVERISSMDRAKYSSIFREIAANRAIHRRVTNIELELLLQRELNSRDISIPFEYRVFNETLATKIGSESFINVEGDYRYQTPLFISDQGESDFDLVIAFPSKKVYLRNSILGTAILSVVFTLFIVIAFSNAIYQIIRQKKISEIKSDFINNMTHEFKTPIATIHLALDAIHNSSVQKNPEKLTQYLHMIRQENKRMHIQVENVLQISQLDRKEISLSQTAEDIHKQLDRAVEHVSLLIQQRKAVLKTSFDAQHSTLLVSNNHMTNVWINILENAIKYSDNTPKIEIKTFNTSGFLCVSVKDHGMGMTNSVKKKVFDKFYRETSGNIHNVKGHGLGLAYVKQIVELHHGMVSVESEKGKGSQFTVKLPLKIDN
ncbi:MAG: HAMP domain-containing sensor histidine kinase [Flavobacteriaceae bacterium]|nr:HAMP domain-containing sensor histidine kinase [Flavobacteriaceae bacterium]MDG2315041.1 HAMP domain-containing sensor histidine kinase [Flavobacteriaceae bacterium]